MNPRYPFVAARAGHKCEYCLAPEALFNFPFEVEHVVPRTVGGADVEDNLALACRSCNVHKGDAVDAGDPLGGSTVRLFNPRAHRWPEHFQVDRTAGQIIGRTALGRASIARLAMNSNAQVEARIVWTKLGLFPPDSISPH